MVGFSAGGAWNVRGLRSREDVVKVASKGCWEVGKG